MENNDTKDIIKNSLISPVKEILADIAEMGVDEAIEKILKEQSVLKDIPVIRWLLLANDVRTTIQSAFFIRKYAHFIGPINKTMKDDLVNETRLVEIFSDKKVFSKIIDQTIICLDRYQTISKADIISKLFIETFKNKNFSMEEYNTLLFSIEFIHPSLGFECLKLFYDYKNELNKVKDKEKRDEILMKNSSLDYSPLVNTGLLVLPKGAMIMDSYGGAIINELGSRFYELVVSKI
jgi:hypothetical protein